MKIIFILITCLSLSACISRLSRPLISGTVVDSEGRFLKDAHVGETQTDAYGRFSLKERRYYAFLFKEILYMEAPAVYVSEMVSLEGYRQCQIKYYNPRGGGQAKGAKWLVGQIVMSPFVNEDAINPVQGVPACIIK